MRSSHRKQIVLMGTLALGLVAAACGKSASATEHPSATASPTTSPTPSPSYGMPGSNTKTVIEGPGNSFAFMPSTIHVKQGTTLMLNNVSDTAHTFTISGQGIDIETQPGQTSHVTIDLEPGSYPFVCRFHRTLGMNGTLVVT